MANLVAIVAEDRLTEAVLQKCTATYLPQWRIARSEIKGGRGNVQRELVAYATLARAMPVLIGVDLDHDNCAPQLLANWQTNYVPHRSLLIRVAVREIESWILADRKRFARFIGAASDDISIAPDTLEDPKATLLTLARATTNKGLRRDLIPRNFAQHPRIGPAYNLRMCEFVGKKWRPHVAQQRSESLARAIEAITSIAA